MSWIIKRIADGKYIYSVNVGIEEKILARRFSSRKQACAYLRRLGNVSDGYTVEELTDSEIAEREQIIQGLKGR